MFLQDPPITIDVQLLESQKKTKKSRPESQPPVRRGKKRSQPTPSAASIPEANASPKKKPQAAPGDQEADPRGEPGGFPQRFTTRTPTCFSVKRCRANHPCPDVTALYVCVCVGVGKQGRKPSKRALEASSDEPPRKRHRGVKVAEKLKVR